MEYPIDFVEEAQNALLNKDDKKWRKFCEQNNMGIPQLNSLIPNIHETPIIKNKNPHDLLFDLLSQHHVQNIPSVTQFNKFLQDLPGILKGTHDIGSDRIISSDGKEKYVVTKFIIHSVSVLSPQRQINGETFLDTPNSALKDGRFYSVKLIIDAENIQTIDGKSIHPEHENERQKITLCNIPIPVGCNACTHIINPDHPDLSPTQVRGIFIQGGEKVPLM